MQIKDFESAANALCVKTLQIDYVKMKEGAHGQVIQMNGHTSKVDIIWDEFGRAFSTPRNSESEEFIIPGEGKTYGRRLSRDAALDLKFS